MKHLILFLMFAIALPVSAETLLTGGLEYNVSSARDEAFDGISYQIDAKSFANRGYDYQNAENYGFLLKGTTKLNDRTLALFSDSTYGVVYNNDPYSAYYYSKDGLLLYVDKKSGLDFPHKFYKYNTAGKLLNTGVRISAREAYIYAPDGSLIAHWVGANGYDENGKVIMTRQILE